jgi:hypothetical protein
MSSVEGSRMSPNRKNQGVHVYGGRSRLQALSRREGGGYGPSDASSIRSSSRGSEVGSTSRRSRRSPRYDYENEYADGDLSENSGLKTEVSKLQDEVLMLKAVMKNMAQDDDTDTQQTGNNTVFSGVAALRSLFKPSAGWLCLSPRKTESDTVEDTVPYVDDYDRNGGRSRGRSRTRNNGKAWRSASRSRYGEDGNDHQDYRRDNNKGQNSMSLGRRGREQPEYDVKPDGEVPTVVPTVVAIEDTGASQVKQRGHSSSGSLRGRLMPRTKRGESKKSGSVLGRRRKNRNNWEEGSTLGTFGHSSKGDSGKRLVLQAHEC